MYARGAAGARRGFLVMRLSHERLELEPEVDGSRRKFLSWQGMVNVPAFGRVRVACMRGDGPGEWLAQRMTRWHTH
jgi:hypothetical protein